MTCVEFARSTDHPAARVGSQRTVVTPRLHAAIAELAAETSYTAGRRLVPPPEQLTLGAAQTFLRELWDATLDIAISPDAVPVADQARLARKLTQIRNLELELAQEQAAARTPLMLSGLNDAIVQLRRADTVDELFATAAEVGHTCLGFDRTLVSRVDNHRWRMEAMHVPLAPQWAEDMVALGQSEPPELDDGIVESEVATARRPGLVLDVPSNPKVFRKLAEMGKSESYALAPVLVSSEVAGFIHADQYFQRRTMTSQDRAVLSVFAEGFGQALSNFAWRERSATAQADAPSARDLRGFDAGLTRREVDVARLLADGLPNGAIAQRLSVSEATVKTHVTSILRKLGASNRTEAIARWIDPSPTHTRAVQPTTTPVAPAVDATHAGLTGREAEVARLLADGLVNSAIARRLAVSEATAKTHVTNLLRKLGASSRAEAVALWLNQSGRSRDARNSART